MAKKGVIMLDSSRCRVTQLEIVILGRGQRHWRTKKNLQKNRKKLHAERSYSRKKDQKKIREIKNVGEFEFLSKFTQKRLRE